MLALTIVGLCAIVVVYSYWSGLRAQRRIAESVTGIADSVVKLAGALSGVLSRLEALEGPEYQGTPIGREIECETPDDMHYQRPTAVSESARQAAGFYGTDPETSPFFTQSPE